MNMETKKLKVEIFNDQYSLISDENEQDLLNAAQLVDELMKKISEKSGIGDAKKVAVLAALKISRQLVNLQHCLDGYKDEQERLAKLINKEGLSSHCEVSSGQS